jgi:hypothetical protein
LANRALPELLLNNGTAEAPINRTGTNMRNIHRQDPKESSHPKDQPNCHHRKRKSQAEENWTESALTETPQTTRITMDSPGQRYYSEM